MVVTVVDPLLSGVRMRLSGAAVGSTVRLTLALPVVSGVFDLKSTVSSAYALALDKSVRFGNGGLTEYLRTDIPGGGELVIAVVGIRSRPSEGLKVTFLDRVSVAVGGDARFGLGVEGGDTFVGVAGDEQWNDAE